MKSARFHGKDFICIGSDGKIGGFHEIWQIPKCAKDPWSYFIK